MKVVFLKDVPGTAQAGQVKEVADGYGRNYLLPRKLAEPATPAALARVEHIKAKAARLKAKAEAQLRELGERLEGVEVTVRAKAGPQGRLYGSVTSADIAEALTQQVGWEIDRHWVALEEPLRQLGSFPVTLRLSGEVAPTVTVVVAAEE